jgi:pantoate--beta-alanine ligase
VPVTTVTTIAELRERLARARADGSSVGFVPTMGYLHAGHASLMAAARSDTDLVVASIFVNPLQFGPSEDLAAYPRDLPRDASVADDAGADLLFVPTGEEMYPDGEVLTTVSVTEVSAALEGASRPTHFAGVATVVAKLFSIVGPCRAYFGEKDYQQVAVIRRMVRDLSMPVVVVACPTIREPDGLAMSSRNAYLTPAERDAAPVVHDALRAGVLAIEAGARDASAVVALVEGAIAAEPLAVVDYVAVVDADTLRPRDALAGEVRLLAAARFGRARLIDNVGARVP